MLNKKTTAFATLLASFAMMASAQVSPVWSPDLGNGKYKNPIIYADYSDPDVCRVGDDYYMTASSFNCIPGLPVLHSKDLVNWTIIGYAIEQMPEYAQFVPDPNHGGAVWAPAIRYHDGEFYIYYGDPDLGIFMTKAKNPAGPWEPLTCVKSAKGIIDTCPLWDEDGNAYLSMGVAGSRMGVKSVLAVADMAPDGKSLTSEPRIVYDGHDIDPTIEGTKFYKRNGYYYILSPAGGVATGWQVALRADNPYGPYERRKVMDQGPDSPVNGPHQGAWVDTPDGQEYWFIHFQDVGAIGRITHLQPMRWVNDWPVIGEDKDGDGCGNPVLTYRKPSVGKPYAAGNPQESDEFDGKTLGLQWSWHGNPAMWWAISKPAEGIVSLYSVPQPEGYKNLWDVSALMLQKIPAPKFTATMKLTFKPDTRYYGERTGLLIMGEDYGLLSFENTKDGFKLSQIECKKASAGTPEVDNESIMLTDPTVYLRVKLNDGKAQFSYSTDNKKFHDLGTPFAIKEGKWIGAKIGAFCQRPITKNDGGRADIDWFRITK